MTVEREVLVDVLYELHKTNAFDYPTRVEHRRQAIYYLVELIPKIERRRYFRNKHRRLGRAAVMLSDVNFTVFQPRWLVPLQEELEAISSVLPKQPNIATDYVEARMLPSGGAGDIYTVGLTAELKETIDEQRIRYWTTKAEIANAKKPELPQGE
ncbi:hypothetical protein KW794_00300 [Candidatus Saccharibacteria bacterium]|nr:hypothetical protein [Candidatus Saccharibacteria bacterium]